MTGCGHARAVFTFLINEETVIVLPLAEDGAQCTLLGQGIDDSLWAGRVDLATQVQ